MAKRTRAASNTRTEKKSNVEKTVKAAAKDAAEIENKETPKEEVLKDVIPLREVKKPEPPKPAPTENGLRYFIVEFTVGYKKDGNPGIINQTADIPGMAGYPSRTALATQLPSIYGVTEEAGFTDINCTNIRLQELSKEDFEAFTKE